jgi:hypothetical protein
MTEYLLTRPPQNSSISEYYSDDCIPTDLINLAIFYTRILKCWSDYHNPSLFENMEVGTAYLLTWLPLPFSIWEYWSDDCLPADRLPQPSSIWQNWNDDCLPVELITITLFYICIMKWWLRIWTDLTTITLFYLRILKQWLATCWPHYHNPLIYETTEMLTIWEYWIDDCLPADLITITLFYILKGWLPSCWPDYITLSYMRIRKCWLPTCWPDYHNACL